MAPNSWPESRRRAEQAAELHAGYATLMRMASAPRYNRWIFEELSPYAGRRVLEVGCGIGNMTAFFAPGRELLLAIDRLPASIAYARARFQGMPQVVVRPGDIMDADLLPELRAHRFDTVVCINVLEHLEDDLTALRHMREVLEPGGNLLLLAPAGRYLYGALDEALGHVRRYERHQLEARVRAAGFAIVELHYLNLLGIPGWFLNSRILKRRLLPAGQLRLFNAIAPPFIWLETRLRRVWDAPLGQSLVCVAQKKPDSGESGADSA